MNKKKLEHFLLIVEIKLNLKVMKLSAGEHQKST